MRYGLFLDAETLLLAGRHREAIAFCRAQLAAWPRSAKLRLLLARALLAVGEERAARAELETCLKIDSSSVEARALLESLVGADPLDVDRTRLRSPSGERPVRLNEQRTAPLPLAPPSARPPSGARSASPPARPASRPAPSARPPSRPATPARPASRPAATARPPSHPSPTARPPSHPASAARPPSHPASAARPPSHPASAARPPSHPASAARPPSHRASTARPPSHPAPAARPPSHPAHPAPAEPTARLRTRPAPTPAPALTSTSAPTSWPAPTSWSSFTAQDAAPLSAPVTALPAMLPARRRRQRWRVTATLGAAALIGALLALIPSTPRLALAPPPAPPPASRPAPPTPPPEPPQPDPGVASLLGDVWIHPLPGPVRRMPLKVSRLFGAGREGNRPRECRGGHCGVDVGGERYGEPVLAAHDGVVDRVRRDANPDHGGHYVRLAHRGGTVFTQYFHLGVIPARLERGKAVKAGDVIGYVGRTGVRHSGPHLHFTVSVYPSGAKSERYLDPEPLLALWPLRLLKPGDLTSTITADVEVGEARGYDLRRTRRRGPGRTRTQGRGGV